MVGGGITLRFYLVTALGKTKEQGQDKNAHLQPYRRDNLDGQRSGPDPDLESERNEHDIG